MLTGIALLVLGMIIVWHSRRVYPKPGKQRQSEKALVKLAQKAIDEAVMSQKLATEALAREEKLKDLVKELVERMPNSVDKDFFRSMVASDFYVG